MDSAKNPATAISMTVKRKPVDDDLQKPRVFFKLIVMFITTPLMIGCLLARIPEIKESLGIDHAELALALIGAPIGTMAILPIAGRLIPVLGIHRHLLIGILVYLISLTLSPHAASIAQLFMILAVAGGAVAFMELGINLCATDYEKQSKTLVMNRLHGGWSIGLMSGSLLAVLFAHLGLGMALSLLLVAILSFAPFVYCSQTLPNPRTLTEDSKAKGGGQPRFPLMLWALVVYMLPLALVEGAVGDWSAIMLREVFDASPAFAGLGLSVFAALHATGRLGGDWLKARLGAQPLALALGVVCLAGNLLVVFSPHAYVAILGFAMFGLGASVGYPLAISAAASLPGKTPQHLATMTFFGIGAFLIGPPLIGFVANLAGLRAGYAVVLPLLVVSLLMSTALRERSQNSQT